MFTKGQRVKLREIKDHWAPGSHEPEQFGEIIEETTRRSQVRGQEDGAWDKQPLPPSARIWVVCIDKKYREDAWDDGYRDVPAEQLEAV